MASRTDLMTEPIFVKQDALTKPASTTAIVAAANVVEPKARFFKIFAMPSDEESCMMYNFVEENGKRE